MRIKSVFFVSAIALAITAASVSAQEYGRTLKGTYSLGGGAFFDTDSAMGRDIQLSFSFGYYLEDGFMLGGYATVYDNAWYNSDGIGATMKWHFWDFGLDDYSMPFSMYVGGDLGMGYVKTGLDSNSAFVVGARWGLDFFITYNVALGISADAHVATDDIYPANKLKGLTNSVISVKLGVTFNW